MKALLPLVVLAAGLLVGCNPDKSTDTQTMAPVSGKPYDAPKTTGAAAVPDAAKSAIPGGAK